MNDPRVAKVILDVFYSGNYQSLSGSSSPNVLYLGTATYDLPVFRTRQTQRLEELGCNIDSLNVAFDDEDEEYILEEARHKLDWADIVVVGGGNTLYAMDRWRHLGLIPLLRQAMERGVMMTGGSAGSIVWFDGGHSNSMDPDTYADYRLKKFGGATTVNEDESSKLGSEIKDWKYIRVDGLGFLPGMVSPHLDRVQSNGILRAKDFDSMLQRHPGERGIGIDHWAALVVSGEYYSVLSLEGKPGSVLKSYDSNNPEAVEFAVDSNGNARGVPGIWIKDVDADGTVYSRVCPPNGRLRDILRVPEKIVRDVEDIQKCREANPSGIRL